MKSKKQTKVHFYIFFVIFGLSGILKMYSQVVDFNLTPEGKLETVFDNRGNQLKLNDILINSSKSLNNRTISCSTTSYFNLYFEPGCGMDDTSDPIHNARRLVICKVFEDISNFINSPLTSTGNKVNIWVRNINNVYANPNGILGLASGFYCLPSSNTVGGIVDNEIWKTIHTGVDSYLNITVPLTTLGGSTNQSGLFYHGMVTFNFNDTAIPQIPNTPALNWNTNLSTSTIPLNNFDLYSVVLHEVTHALGFSSLIDTNGNSVFGTNFKYFNRYDTFLKTNNLSQFLLKTTSCSSMYNNSFNNTITTNVLHPNPHSCIANFTNCNDAIKFAGTTVVPVYTPNCFNSLSSLSHFEDTHFPNCNTSNPIYGNDNYFLMCNSGNSGMTRRFLKSEERLALCDIGYSVNSTYGSSSTANGFINYGAVTCNGIQVAGVNDGINTAGNYTFIGNSGTNIVINGNTILSNDRNALTFECLEDLTATSANPTTFSATSGNATTNITFNSTLAGLHLLRYTPANGAQKGNITYIYVYVSPIITSCTTTPSSCNLVRNGNFEANNVNITDLSDFEFNKVCDWVGKGFQSFYFLQNNSTLYYSIPCNFIGNQNDNIIGNKAFGGIRLYSFTNGTTTSGILATKLTSTLTPNSTYQINFDVSQTDFYRYKNYQLQAFVSSMPPQYIPQGTGLITNSNLSRGILISNQTVSNNNNGWETITLTFTTNSTQTNLEYLYIGILNNATSSIGTSPATLVNCNINTTFIPITGSGYYIDNVSLIATGGAVINVPPTICSTQTLNDLSIYLSGTTSNGVFSGTGVTLVNGVYTFNAAVAGIGTTTIGYTFTNSSGCTTTLYDTINISSTSSNSITAIANDDDFTNYPINNSLGGSTLSVYSNDIYNNLPTYPSTLTNVTFELINPIAVSGATINNMGLINIPAGTAAGTYNITYKLTVLGNCNTSDLATVTIKVVDNSSTTLAPGIRANNEVFCTELQSTGKVIIAGQFFAYNNIPVNRFVRLNQNLTLDTTFNMTAGSPANLSYAVDLKIQNDDKIIVTGIFDQFGGGNGGKSIARLLPNGSFDTTFNNGGIGLGPQPGSGARWGYSIALQPDGKILVGGYFYSYNGVVRKGIVRINSNGSIDSTFNPIELNTYYESSVYFVTLQPDGKILLSGLFQLPVPGPVVKHLIRLNSDGSIDNSFTKGDLTGSINHYNISVSLNRSLAKPIIQPDGKIIVLGAFTKYNGLSTNNIVRLYSNGNIDSGFHTATGTDRAINVGIIEQISNKIIIGGEFTVFGSTPVKKMIRLNTNGTLDTTFTIGSGTTDIPITSGNSYANNFIKQLKQQPDGKIIVAGKFNTFNGLSATNITRIFGNSGIQTRSLSQKFVSEPEIDTNPSYNAITIYPNPSNGVYNIDLSYEKQPSSIAIYNVLGELVYNQLLTPETQNQINLTHLANGYYIARINNDSSSTQQKLIKN